MSYPNKGQQKLVARALSLADIGKIAGVSRPTVSRWKKGEITPKQLQRERIEAELDIPCGDWDRALEAGDIIPTDVHIKSGPKAKSKPRTYRKPNAAYAPQPPPQAPQAPPQYQQPPQAPPQAHVPPQAPQAPYTLQAPAFPAYPDPPEDGSTLDMVRHSLACLQHDLQHRGYTAAGRSKARADERGALALIAKLEATEELKEDRYVRSHPEWKRLRDCILRALEKHPEASRDVMEAVQMEYGI